MTTDLLVVNTRSEISSLRNGFYAVEWQEPIPIHSKQIPKVNRTIVQVSGNKGERTVQAIGTNPGRLSDFFLRDGKVIPGLRIAPIELDQLLS